MSAPIAMVFPGQGSQAVGMLTELAAAWPVVGETFAEASEVLGEDLWRLVREGPPEVLNRTANTQPAMLAAGVAVWRVWTQAGGRTPAWMAGHSLGEFSALVGAGALEFAAAVGLVAERGRRMQEAVPDGEGAMAALLGLDDDRVRALCQAQAEGQVLEAVNFNAPGQVVIAGAAAAVGRAVAGARAAGARRALPLPVSVPSHCALMRPAAEHLAAALAAVPLVTPRVPVLHNVSAEPCRDPAAIRDRLVRQLSHPVRWVESVRRLAAEGVGVLIEAGPGQVLTGLTKRIDKRLEARAVFDPESLAAALEVTENA